MRRIITIIGEPVYSGEPVKPNMPLSGKRTIIGEAGYAGDIIRCYI